MPPAQWYARGIRLLGRTAVECTRDALADLIGSDIAHLAARLQAATGFTVIDPFAGSCNTLYWILRDVRNSEGIACEFDPQVYDLTRRNIANLDCKIQLLHGDYRQLLQGRPFPAGHGLIVFVAPPWGTALDEAIGLDLRRTTPPITEISEDFVSIYPDRRMLFATQVYEKVNLSSLEELGKVLDWSDLRVYRINEQGRNHGILLGTKGWTP
jgi:hypothetical protein